MNAVSNSQIIQKPHGLQCVLAIALKVIRTFASQTPRRGASLSDCCLADFIPEMVEVWSPADALQRLGVFFLLVPFVVGFKGKLKEKV